MNTRTSDILLGVVFFGALIGLGVVTIVLSDFAIGVESHTLELLSDDVGYLRPGDPVLLHGMASGKVTSIQRLGTPRQVSLPGPSATSEPRLVDLTVRIVVDMDVDPRPFLRSDHKIQIEERGLLGGKLIRIDTGTAEGPPPADAPLLAMASDTVIQAAGTILEENRENLQRTIDNLAEMTEDAKAGKGTVGLLMSDPDMRARISEIVDDVARIGDRLANGQGTLGKLLTDETIFVDARAFVSDLRSTGERLKRGEGTIGKLLQEEAVYDDLASLSSDLAATVRDARAGKGTVGRLLTDETLYADTAETMANLRTITADAQAGKGTVGRLLTDETLYENAAAFFGTDLQATVDKLGEVLDDVTAGKGLVATLLNDEKLADDFRDIVAQALGAIEDARETTPVQSLGSFLFGTF